LVGSLLLGHYHKARKLDDVAFTSGIPDGERPEFTKRLGAIIEVPGFTGRPEARAGGARSTQPLRPELVTEFVTVTSQGVGFATEPSSCDGARQGTASMHIRPNGMAIAAWQTDRPDHLGNLKVLNQTDCQGSQINRLNG
jgi:hypothetical protein